MKLLRSIGLNDLVGALGFGMVGVGLWLWSPAAALVVCGAVLMGLAILGEVRRT
jgi:hypothetical protein